MGDPIAEAYKNMIFEAEWNGPSAEFLGSRRGIHDQYLNISKDSERNPDCDIGEYCGYKKDHGDGGKTLTWRKNDKEVDALLVINRNGNSNCNIDHMCMDIGSKALNSSIPNGYIGNQVYREFKSSNIPFVTSESITEKGKKSMETMAKKAISEGHFVYHSDGQTLSRIDGTSHIKQWAAKGHPGIQDHLIFSKSPLSI